MQCRIHDYDDDNQKKKSRREKKTRSERKNLAQTPNQNNKLIKNIGFCLKEPEKFHPLSLSHTHKACSNLTHFFFFWFSNPFIDTRMQKKNSNFILFFKKIFFFLLKLKLY